MTKKTTWFAAMPCYASASPAGCVTLAAVSFISRIVAGTVEVRCEQAGDGIQRTRCTLPASLARRQITQRHQRHVAKGSLEDPDTSCSVADDLGPSSLSEHDAGNR